MILSINHKDHPGYEISGSENHNKKKEEVGFKEVINIVNIDYCVIQYIVIVKSHRRSGTPPGADSPHSCDKFKNSNSFAPVIC